MNNALPECTHLSEMRLDCHPSQETWVPKAFAEPKDTVGFPVHKRLFTQYVQDEDGVTSLHLYYGDKEIVFDDPALFAFGETLAKTPRFTVETAMSWGQGYDLPQVQTLIQTLLEEDILQWVDSIENRPVCGTPACSSPLPPAQTTVPQTWLECAAITQALTGRSVELAYLELIVPIYRIAHVAIDTEGRQVGEANVFPAALRLDVPTEWRRCPHPGSRYQAEHPMNVTALKSMRMHWTQTLIAIRRIREEYMKRFPATLEGWTVGDLQRLSTVILTLPAYLMLRTDQRVENGDLHPVISAMFRVTDGVRMTMQHMLFVPVDDVMFRPETPMTAQRVYAYAERNAVFFSEAGVCAGPKAMVEEFLSVLVDGGPIKGAENAEIDPYIQAVLDDLAPVFDYALLGLQAHAVVLSLWPVMTRCYERLLGVSASWPPSQHGTLAKLRTYLEKTVDFLRNRTLVGRDAWRSMRENAVANMYRESALGRGLTSADATLFERLSAPSESLAEPAERVLRSILTQQISEKDVVEPLIVALMDYLRQEQVIVRAACDLQQEINQRLGRKPPHRLFTAADMNLFYLMQDGDRQPPYLVGDLEDILGINVTVTQDNIVIMPAPCSSG